MTGKSAFSTIHWIAGAGVGSAAVAVVFLSYASRADLLRKWMSRRATAETARLAYFGRVTSEAAARAADAANFGALAPLQLEYFRRFQLQLQLAYYRGRGKQHERAGKHMVVLGVAALGVAGLASLAPFIGASWIPLAAFGAVAAALGAFASSMEGMRQDRRNAERYERTHGSLLELQGRLDDVRSAVARRGHAPLTAYVEAVHDQLSLEHRQWLKLREGMSSALKKLEDALQERGALPDAASTVPAPTGAEAG